MEEQAKAKKERNYYIDFLRGLAAISVVLIHTAFHSGKLYVPEIARNMTLLFEVPMFMFLAGWSFSYVKKTKKYVKGLVSLQFKYMFYMVIVFGMILIANQFLQEKNNVTILDFLKNIFHDYTSTYPFRSVKSSLWFFGMYFVTVFAGLGIIKLNKPIITKIVIILSVIFIGINTCIHFGDKIDIALGVTLDVLVFYLFFFLLGYVAKNITLSAWQFAGLIIINIGLLAITNFVIGSNPWGSNTHTHTHLMFTNGNIFDLQNNKFPPQWIYFLWSMFGIYIVVFLKKYVTKIKKSNLIVKLGQNAIYLFFAQGISASLLYFISPYIDLIWYLKLPLMFIINLVMAIPIMIILKQIIERLVRLVWKIIG